jgi:hypothetical protein
VLLTRGFASQPHGWFALIEEVPTTEKIVCIGGQQAKCQRARDAFLGQFLSELGNKTGWGKGPCGRLLQSLDKLPVYNGQFCSIA